MHIYLLLYAFHLAPLLLLSREAPPVPHHGDEKSAPGVELPPAIALHSEYGAVVLPISINGSDPLPILLDTGMPSPGVALFHGPHIDELQLEFAPTIVRIGGAGGAARHEARVSLGARLELGDVRIEDTQLIVMPPIQHFDPGYAGIIGWELLASFAVTVDFDAGQVYLSSPRDFAPRNNASRIPLDLVGSMPYVDVQLRGSSPKPSTARLLLDLGDHFALSLSEGQSLIDTQGSGLSGTVRRRIGRGLSGPLFGRMGRVQTLELGGHRLHSVVTSIRESSHDLPLGTRRAGSLGVGLLNRFHFTIDYANHALYLSPNKRFHESFEADMSGLDLESDSSGSLCVVEVFPGSPASRAEIQAGDIVTEVDGTAVTGSDRQRLLERFRQAGEITLKIKRAKEEPRMAQLRLQRII
ncbi:MAG: aspartyl protease family protein [Planctomycetota bacterium]